jgi:hypothetical protein
MLLRPLLLLAVTTSLVAACTQDEATACGKGSEYRDGDCHPIVPRETPGSSAGTGGEGGEAGAAPSIDPAFGEPCESSDTCASPTNYCTPPSPVDTQYCTVSGCDQDASLCPAGWTCFDVGQFVDGEPFVCTRPTE